jgi:hypothetical protein
MNKDMAGSQALLLTNMVPTYILYALSPRIHGPSLMPIGIVADRALNAVLFAVADPFTTVHKTHAGSEGMSTNLIGNRQRQAKPTSVHEHSTFERPFYQQY